MTTTFTKKSILISALVLIAASNHISAQGTNALNNVPAVVPPPAAAVDGAAAGAIDNVADQAAASPFAQAAAVADDGTDVAVKGAAGLTDDAGRKVVTDVLDNMVNQVADPAIVNVADNAAGAGATGAGRVAAWWAARNPTTKVGLGLAAAAGVGAGILSLVKKTNDNVTVPLASATPVHVPTNDDDQQHQAFRDALLARLAEQEQQQEEA